jgi:hypothetical protein
MSKLNTKRLIENIRERTTVYAPLVEAVVNSIQAIEETKRRDGVVQIVIQRSNQAVMQLEGDDKVTAPVIGFTVTDNGIGFTKSNRDSFDTVYSEQKRKIGGQGFGRFTYLKYFKNVRVESTYQEDGLWNCRTFNFVDSDPFIKNEINISVLPDSDNELRTSITMTELQVSSLDQTAETISRKLLEKILVYFIRDDYEPPKIVIQDPAEHEEIVLNDYLSGQGGQVRQIKTTNFTVRNGDHEQIFSATVFKIYFPDKKSRISLTAHQREVTEALLERYIPEFGDDFYDEVERQGKKPHRRDYMIKVYVSGKYLDENVSPVRDSFEFPKDDSYGMTSLFGLTQKHIEQEASRVAKEAMPNEIKLRKDKKSDQIRDYVKEKAPWYRSMVKGLDLDSIPYKFTEAELESEFHKVRFQREQQIKKQAKDVLDQPNDIVVKARALVANVSEIARGDLEHYVALRKVILDTLKRSLQIKPDGKYQEENVVHNIIFPVKTDSDELPYEKHHLWILDEKLNFTEYLASDESLGKGNKARPDLLAFHQFVAYRGGGESHNPITIFEFKRPQREDFASKSKKENPVDQLIRYVNDIRDGKYKTPVGRDISVGENTPFYGYVVCDLTPEVRSWLEREEDFKPLPDGQGYYNWKSNNNLYIEVISWDKMVKDAEQRNLVFFKKLGFV